MPTLTNPKHEAFAQHLALDNSCNQTEAARLAGYTGDHLRSTAAHLYARPEIRARVEELTQRVVQQLTTVATISRQWVIDGLIRVAAKAEAKEEFGEARQCLKDIGIDLGMFVKKTETKLELPTDIAQFSEAQLLQLQHWLERMRYGNDEQAILDMRRRTGVLELEAVDVVPQEKEQDGW